MIGIGKKIKLLRVERDMSQTQLGELLGVSQSALAHYESETRKIDLDVVGKLCEVFDVTSDWLIGKTENRTPKSDDVITDGLTKQEKEEVEDFANYLRMKKIMHPTKQEHSSTCDDTDGGEKIG